VNKATILKDAKAGLNNVLLHYEDFDPHLGTIKKLHGIIDQAVNDAEKLEIPKVEKGGEWHCPNCGYLSGSRVDNDETCDTCHQPVEWHDFDKMTAFERLEAWRVRQMTFIHLMRQSGKPCECGCKGCQGDRANNEKHYNEWEKEAKDFEAGGEVKT